jgi:transposase
MDESVKDDATDGSRFVRRIGFRRSRSGKRLWPTELKGRIVRESLAPGVRVADVACKNGLCAQQLTEWRRAARSAWRTKIHDRSRGSYLISSSAPRPTSRDRASDQYRIFQVNAVLQEAPSVSRQEARPERH